MELREAVEEPPRFEAAREAVTEFCFDRLLPHLDGDEQWLAEAEECTQGGALLAEAMRVENRAMTAAVWEIAGTPAPCEAVAATRVLHALLAIHTQHEQRLRSVIAHS